MEQSDFIDRVKQFLDACGYECEINRLDAMKGKQGICIREISRRKVRSDYGGESTFQVIYQVAVRSRDPAKAEADCWGITEKLEDASLDSANGSYEFDSQEVYTSPQELDLKETLYFAWQVRFNAEIRQK